MSLSNQPITPDKFDAVLFDLDSVITATAKVHATCLVLGSRSGDIDPGLHAHDSPLSFSAETQPSLRGRFQQPTYSA